jgi:DNA repair exonuclease SbcCD ATPase subunit
VEPGKRDQVPVLRRIRFLVRRFVLIFASRMRRAFGVAAQNLQRDELGELRKETRALGSASVESVSHMGAELREINERLSKLESDIEALRGMLGERTAGATEAEGELTREHPGEASPESLTAD